MRQPHSDPIRPKKDAIHFTARIEVTRGAPTMVSPTGAPSAAASVVVPASITGDTAGGTVNLAPNAFPRKNVSIKPAKSLALVTLLSIMSRMMAAALEGGPFPSSPSSPSHEGGKPDLQGTGTPLKALAGLPMRAPTSPAATSAAAAAVASLARPHTIDGMLFGAHLLDSSLQLGQVFVPSHRQGGDASSGRGSLKHSAGAENPDGLSDHHAAATHVYVPSGVDALLGPSKKSEAADQSLLVSFVSVTSRSTRAANYHPGSRSGSGSGSGLDLEEAVSDYCLMGGTEGSPSMRISGMRARRMPLEALRRIGGGGGRIGGKAALPQAGGVPHRDRAEHSPARKRIISDEVEEGQLVYRTEWAVQDPADPVDPVDLHTEAPDTDGHRALSFLPAHMARRGASAAVMTAALMSVVAAASATTKGDGISAVSFLSSSGLGMIRSPFVTPATRHRPTDNKAKGPYTGGFGATVASYFPASLLSGLMQGLAKTAAQEDQKTAYSVTGGGISNSGGMNSAGRDGCTIAFGPQRGLSPTPPSEGGGLQKQGAFGADEYGNAVFVPRLVPELGVTPGPAGPYRLVPRSKGSLESLVPEPVVLSSVGESGSVLISVRAVGINFRDVLNVSPSNGLRTSITNPIRSSTSNSTCNSLHPSVTPLVTLIRNSLRYSFYPSSFFLPPWQVLGMYPGDPGAPGSDFSGVIARHLHRQQGGIINTDDCHLRLSPGTAVFGLSTGALGSHVISSSETIALLPPSVSFEDAAAAPTIQVRIQALGIVWYVPPTFHEIL